jgi:hypothetical protein
MVRLFDEPIVRQVERAPGGVAEFGALAAGHVALEETPTGVEALRIANHGAPLPASWRVSRLTNTATPPERPACTGVYKAGS